MSDDAGEEILTSGPVVASATTFANPVSKFPHFLCLLRS